MKHVFTLLVMVVLAGTLTAQHYQIPFLNAGQNPGNLNVDAAQPTANPILGSGSTDWSSSQTIPFSFMFDGNSYSQLYIAPTGIVTFTSVSGAAPSDANVTIPSATIPDNSICMWGLNLTGGNDGVATKTYGTAPNRQFWISWKSASWAGIGSTSWAYWSIVLEETSNAVYIVDERNLTSAGVGPELTAGLQYSSSSAISVTGSPNLTATNLATGGSDEGVSDNSYYAFFTGTQPDYDASMSNLDMPNFIQVNSGGIDVTGTITNFGAQTITSAVLAYSVNGGAQISQYLTGLNIPSGGSAVITHPTQWTPLNLGSNVIEFWATQINGQPDANTANDRTSKDVKSYSSSYPRTVLYETFTSSTCGPCVAGNANFEGIIANIPSSELSSIKYQMSWPGSGDPYNTADGNSRRNYYGVNSVPRMEADGGWDGNSGSFTISVHQDAIQLPAFVHIAATYQVDLALHKVTTCATIIASQDLGSATLQIVIKENETTQNTGTNGETEFFDVVKKMVPDANGQAITITNGMNQTICTDYTFQGNFRLPNSANDLINDAIEHSVEEFTDLSVVVWIQQNDKTVLNSTNAINSSCNPNDFVVSGTVIDNQALGSITLAVSGAVAPYTYSWTGPNGFTSNTKDLTGLSSPGNYTVVITDSNGCTRTEIYFVGGDVGGACASADIVINSSVIDSQDSGLILLGVTGSAPPFTYSWTGPNGFTANTKDISHLTDQGTYDVVVTDANGCTSSESFNVGGVVTVQDNDFNTNIVLYPNPASNYATVSISSENATVANVKVVDLIGKTIIEMNNVSINSGINNIELAASALNSGIYLVVVTMNDTVSTEQLIIKK